MCDSYLRLVDFLVRIQRGPGQIRRILRRPLPAKPDRYAYDLRRYN